MHTALLTTKLTVPPPRAGLIVRPRLLARLDEGMAAGVTLISAPAGFGKTTLVAEWVRCQTLPAAWLSLDEADNDPAHFYTYLLAALQCIAPHVGVTTQALLAENPELLAGEALLNSLIADLTALPEPFILVLDDFHFIQLKIIHHQLGFLLDHRPPQMHVVIATREDPALPLSRLRARFRMVEIRRADLGFSLEEVTELLQRKVACCVAPADIIALHARTEGWITGLQLALLSVQDQVDVHRLATTLTGDYRYVQDYLMDEVLQCQPPEVQAFLLHTSILDRMCAPLCEAVLGRNGGPPADTLPAPLDFSTPAQDMLERLEAANLFIIPLDMTRSWYRYHHLFADLLRHRVRSQLGSHLNLLHRRAAQWCASQGLIPEAIHHALAGQDWAQAAALISSATNPLLMSGELVTLLGWFGALPDSVVQASAQLCLDCAWPLLLSDQIGPAQRLLARARELAPTEDPPPRGDLQVFLGWVASAEACVARAAGDLPRAAELAQHAFAVLPGDATVRGAVGVILGMTYWHSGRLADAEQLLQEASSAALRMSSSYARSSAQLYLGRVMAARGNLREAAAVYEAVLAEDTSSPAGLVACLDLADLHYEWHDLAAATDYLSRGQALAERRNYAEHRLTAYLTGARIQCAQGSFAEARRTLRNADQLVRSESLPTASHAQVVAAGVELALAGHDLPEAGRWAADLADATGAHPFYPFVNLARPRLLLAQGRQRVAAAALAKEFDRAVQAGWGYAAIAIRVWQALAAETPQVALPFLMDALRRAEPERYIRTFVDAGPALAPLLTEAARQGIAPGYVGEILRALAPRATPAAASAAGLAEPLSRRELEVLRLVAAGLSNRAIAEKLLLSEGTVKAHVHNIKGKLAAANRTTAVARAREFGLI